MSSTTPSPIHIFFCFFVFAHDSSDTNEYLYSLGTHVKNITFRNNYLYKSVKGIYLKFATPTSGYIYDNLTALVENVVYENITIFEPSQWPIWIGPAQQADARNPWYVFCVYAIQCNVLFIDTSLVFVFY